MPCRSLDFTCRSNSSESFLIASIRTLNRFFSKKKNFLVSDGRILFFDRCKVKSFKDKRRYSRNKKSKKKRKGWKKKGEENSLSVYAAKKYLYFVSCKSHLF